MVNNLVPINPAQFAPRSEFPRSTYPAAPPPDSGFIGNPTDPRLPIGPVQPILPGPHVPVAPFQPMQAGPFGRPVPGNLVSLNPLMRSMY